MIDLQLHEAGIVLRVRAHAAGRANEIRGVHDRMLRVSVTATREKGKANQAIGTLLSKSLGVPKSCVELLSGATSAHKRFLIRGVTADEVVRILSEFDANLQE